MSDIKELRRLAQAALVGPDGVSLNWIKLLQDFQQTASPAAVLELLARLEAAEKERDWHAERCEDAMNECEALRAKIEGVGDERMIDERRIADLMVDLNGVGHENDALRAKIAEMERQEPVELNFIELRNSAQKIVESYVYFRRLIANTPLENDIATLMACFVFAQLDAKGE